MGRSQVALTVVAGRATAWWVTRCASYIYFLSNSINILNKYSYALIPENWGLGVLLLVLYIKQWVEYCSSRQFDLPTFRIITEMRNICMLSLGCKCCYA
jgi:hypothetical protein